MSDNTRPKQTITTKSGITAELLTYITQRENRLITKGYFDEAEIIKGEDKAKARSEVMASMQDLELSTVVVSLNGSTEKVLERLINDIPLPEFIEIKDAIDIVLGKKKAPDTSTQ